MVRELTRVANAYLVKRSELSPQSYYLRGMFMKDKKIKRLLNLIVLILFLTLFITSLIITLLNLVNKNFDLIHINFIAVICTGATVVNCIMEL